MPTSAEPATLGGLVRELTARLEAQAGGAARTEAQRLVMLATECDRTTLLTGSDRAVPVGLVARARELAARRAAGEPFAYLKGVREFWGLAFEVGPGVLVPRPESETMIEAALAHLPDGVPASVVDLGTGSGCLLLTVLHERRQAVGLGVERSTSALTWADRNRRKLGLGGRCLLVQGSWLDAVAGRFDLVLANPPYIPAAEIAALMTDVKDHEPRIALDGGDDGLQPHRVILARLAAHLAPGGLALFEIGHEQGDLALRTARDAGYPDARLLCDLAGRHRCLAITQPPGVTPRRR